MSNRDKKRRKNKSTVELNKAEIEFALVPRPCRHCGVCCRVYGISLCDEDLEREPRLKELAVSVAELPQKTQPTFLKRLGEKYCIRYGKDGDPCPFLYEEKGKYFCSIYETRPNACRRFPASLLFCKIAALYAQGFDLNLNMKRWTVEGIPQIQQIATVLCIDPERLKQFKGKAFAVYEDVYYQSTNELLESVDFAVKDDLSKRKG